MCTNDGILARAAGGGKLSLGAGDPLARTRLPPIRSHGRGKWEPGPCYDPTAPHKTEVIQASNFALSRRVVMNVNTSRVLLINAASCPHVQPHRPCYN